VGLEFSETSLGVHVSCLLGSVNGEKFINRIDFGEVRFCKCKAVELERREETFQPRPGFRLGLVVQRVSGLENELLKNKEIVTYGGSNLEIAWRCGPCEESRKVRFGLDKSCTPGIPIPQGNPAS